MGEYRPDFQSDGAGFAVVWPIAAPYLHALQDMGLSDTQIARYFGVAPQRVSELSRAYEQRETTEA
ncbi:hypothetical protein [Amorphus sp. 3PC139-8]|uniref:hypothetical protein n=1 Tax=Amorphus sp. 3PC139-8 TaxID=2735676 RepID=UPI00345CDE78